MLKSRRFFVNTELLLKIRRQGVPILEMEVDHLPRSIGVSKVGFLEIPRTLLEIIHFH